MVITRFTKLYLFSFLVLTSIVYVMLKFNVVLFYHVRDFEVWNDIAMNVSITLATSLGFWFVTELVGSIDSGVRSHNLREDFINGATKLYNEHVHSLYNPRKQPNEQVPSYLEITVFDITEAIRTWIRRVVAKQKFSREDAEQRALKRVSFLLLDLKHLRANFDPYHSSFPKPFNDKINNLLRTLELNEDQGWEDPIGQAAFQLSIVRSGLIELVNEHNGNRRGKKQKDEPK